MNFLRRLELQGFKSFAAKTVLEFPARVVAIVGPNGSGKSNIIDAFRWVLGEREAKTLRGQSLENLIFGGTPKKPAASLARVGLFFDNHEQKLPFEGTEVGLVRKVDRSGNSEFFLNDSEIRLKDLVPLLARARLGARGLNMIGQGESDVFVRSTPEERRLMIEEILGLREFRIKKNQSERRLESSHINLDKVHAMLEELAPHLRILRRQKSRFDKRSEVEDNLKTLENQYFSFHRHSLLEGLEKLEVPVKKLSEEKHAKEKEITHDEHELKKIDETTGNKERGKQIREQIATLITKKSSLERELARLEVKREFQASAPERDHTAAELMGVLKSFLNEVESMARVEDIVEIKRILERWHTQLKKLLHEGTEKNGTLSDDGEIKLKKELEIMEKELGKLRDDEEAFALDQEKLNAAFRTQIEGLEAKKNELRRIEQELQTHFFEKEKLELKLQELEREWLSFGRHKDELHALPKTSESIDSLESSKKMMRLRGELAAIGEIDEALVKEAEESEKRYEFLSREVEDLEKASTDLRHLIKELDEKIQKDFKNAFSSINEAFNSYFHLMFNGGRAKLKIVEEEKIEEAEAVAGEGTETVEVAKEEKRKSEEDRIIGVDIELHLPKKKISNLNMLSGGEKSLVSLAALFALISVSPPPFLVLDEIDAPLDESNAGRFAGLIKEFSKHTQFIVVTHNRATMEAADVLYGITMGEDGVSTVLSIKLDTEAPQTVH